MQSSYLPKVITKEIKYVYCFLQIYVESVTTVFEVSRAIIEIKQMLNSTKRTSYLFQFNLRLASTVTHNQVSKVIHLQSLLNHLNITFQITSDDESLFFIPRQITGDLCLQNQERVAPMVMYGKTLHRKQYAKYCEKINSSKNIPRNHCHHVHIKMTTSTSITWACEPINVSDTSLAHSAGRGISKTYVYPACVLAFLLALWAI